ncbi:MAG: U32 family peptidase, partial [Tissierellia bacterium]|nr:U32 family peptidase [Tissierellia bacterium]
MNKEVELLAPVGSMDALKAAIQNGANAVYLGGKKFNARQYASNFDDDEILEAILYAHLRGVKVYITLNILLDESELSDAIDYVRYLRKIGADAIIVQDIGFASIIREIFLDMDLHASTQMTVNNMFGIEHLENMGFKRVVLAREVPLKEIKSISNKTEVELEVFVHGALCFSYSGQCLMSSFIGGRSGNRGTCAQPCRMSYTPVNDKGEALLDWDKLYLLSTRDLNTMEEINNLILVGVKSFKVEGRMKRPEYVATIVSAYRKAIDFGIQTINDGEKKDVESIFNRGFTKGLTFGDFGRDFVNVDRPDNRGRVIGKITDSNKDGIFLRFDEDVSAGDGIEWDNLYGEQNGIKLTRDYYSGEIYY